MSLIVLDLFELGTDSFFVLLSFLTELPDSFLLTFKFDTARFELSDNVYKAGIRIAHSCLCVCDYISRHTEALRYSKSIGFARRTDYKPVCRPERFYIEFT